MSWGMVAVAGASVVGGAMSADAAGDAAEGQAAATDRENALTQKQFDQLRSDQAPYRQFGAGTVNKLSQLLGIGSPGGFLVDTTAGAPRANQALYKSDPAYRAAWDEVAGIHHGGYGKDYVDTSDARWIEDMVDRRYAGEDAEFGSLLKNFTGEDLQNDPGYKFRLEQGTNALNNRLAAGGSFFSGKALKAGQNFAQGLASQEFGDAFNRDSANKTRTYNFLSGGASLGQNAAAQTGNAGMQMAQTVGSNNTALANAQGAAGIAQGNAWAGGINGAVGGYQQNELLNRITGGNRGWGSNWGNAMNNGTAYG